VRIPPKKIVSSLTQLQKKESINQTLKKRPRNRPVLVFGYGSLLWKPIISFKGIPENNEHEPFIFDIEDEIFNICRTFSLDSKNQQNNLIETIKQNCRRIVREKTGKKPFTNINIARI